MQSSWSQKQSKFNYSSAVLGMALAGATMVYIKEEKEGKSFNFLLS